MSVVLVMVQVAVVLLLVVPLVVAAVHALRRAGREIDRILREECETEQRETPVTPPGHVIRSAGGTHGRMAADPWRR